MSVCVYVQGRKELQVSLFQALCLLCLSVCLTMSVCMSVCVYVQGRKELQVSLFQALCLLLFNDAHEFLLQDIQDATKIGLCLAALNFFRNLEDM